MDSVAPAAEGFRGFVGWFSGLLGSGQANVSTILATSLGVSAGAATVIAWVLVSMTTIGLAWKFRALVFWGFAFIVLFVVVTGLGVKLS